MQAVFSRSGVFESEICFKNSFASLRVFSSTSILFFDTLASSYPIVDGLNNE